MVVLRDHNVKKILQTRNLKFRIYPNQNQWRKIQDILDACRWVYNKMIEQTQKGLVTRNELNYFLTELKEQEPWLYSYHSKMLQMISTQIDSAQKSLIQLRKNGHKTKNMRFARYSEFRTIIYNQSGFKIQDGFIHISKIGKIKMIQHRQMSDNIEVKQVIITKSKSGKWYACVTCDIVEPLFNIPKIDFKKAVGIDVGIKSFTYDSDGYFTSNPLNLKKMLKPLVRIQREKSRRKKGSNNRLKTILCLQRMHEKIANRRKNFQHKLSKQYATNNDVIFVEKLQKLYMVKNHRLARSIMDSSWGTFCKNWNTSANC